MEGHASGRSQSTGARNRDSSADSGGQIREGLEKGRAAEQRFEGQLGTSCGSDSAPGELPAGQNDWGKGRCVKMVGVEPGERQEPCHRDR